MLVNKSFLYISNSFSKIDYLRENSDIEWPNKLHEACLAANTHFKRALKTTPFKLMFGRDFNPAYLFRANNIEFEEEPTNDDISIESDTNESNYDPPVNSNEWIDDIDSCRSADYQLARSNIRQDQARQKLIFDAKVQRNRCEFY